MSLQGNGTMTSNGTALTPSEARIVQALTRVLFERWAIERRIEHERLMKIIDERFTSLREHVDEAIMDAEDMLDEDEEPDEDEDEFEERRRR